MESYTGRAFSVVFIDRDHRRTGLGEGGGGGKKAKDKNIRCNCKRAMMDTFFNVLLLWFIGCLTSQQHANVSQGRICSGSCKCCHTETEVADQTFCLTQSQYADTGPSSPSTDTITPGRVTTGVPMLKSLV